MKPERLRIGTRKSMLALIQTNLVINQIVKHCPHIKCEIVPITTSGDLIPDRNLYDIGGKALFLKEIEKALIEQQIDIAVHSLKDVPGILSPDLQLAAMLEREDPRDVLVSLKGHTLEELPQGIIVGTSSVRRKVTLHKIRPDLKIVMMRGNVDSRIKRVKAGEVDAIIIAAAGLIRTNLFDHKYCRILSPAQMLPAVGQGVITVQVRTNDTIRQELCNKINHGLTWDLMQGERAYLEYLDASCRTPLAAHATYYADLLTVNFMMSDFEGSYMLFHTETGVLKEGRTLGIRAAKIMLDKIAALPSLQSTPLLHRD